MRQFRSNRNSGGIKSSLRLCARILLAIAVTLASRPTFAAVPRGLAVSAIRFQALHGESDFVVGAGARAELDLGYIHRLSELARTELRMSVADAIPANLKPSESEAKVARRIIGHSVERWLETSSWGRGFGEALRALDAPLSSEVRATDKAGVAHSVKLHMKAARALASVDYRGWVDATLAYQATSRALGLEVSRAVARGQKIIFTATAQPSESRQIVGYQIEW